MLPSLDSLRCFVAAARLLRFRAAAKSLALTPAAFGQRIKQLEDAFGSPLFDRTTRKVTLTDSGLRLLPAAEKALAAAADCARAARGGTGLPDAEITLGTRHELGISWIVPQLDALEKKYPTLGVHLYFGSGPDLILRVRTMEIDCAVTSTRFTDPKLQEIVLCREDYVLVGSPALLCSKPLRKNTDAASHTLLDISAELPLFRYVRDTGADLRFARVVRLGTIAAIRARALSGAGVAVLPRYFVKQDLEKKKLVRALKDMTPMHDHFRLIFRGDDPRRRIYEELAAFFSKEPLR
ncbi:MAG: LysR family transcriptional regulator [Polyangiaceae bacterium]|nr:LysR family transcriptional regulator [Polyangiaceae bacterium]